MKLNRLCRVAAYLVGALSTPLCAMPLFAQDAAAAGGAGAAGSNVAAGGNTLWLNYKGDLQRTGAVDVRLGAPLNLMWRYSSDIAAKEYDTTPLVVGPASQRRIYFAADRYVVCLDGQTGAQIWRSKALSRPVTSPIILVPSEIGDLILAVTSSGQLNALRTSDGGQAWQVPAYAPVQNIAPLLFKTPAGDRIMLALATGRLVAFTLSGQPDENWDIKLGSFSATPTATPALSPDGDYLYIPTQDKKLYVVDVKNASVAFTITLDSAVFSSPMVLNDQLLVTTTNILQSMKLATGQTQWRFGSKSDFGAPAAAKTGIDGAPPLIYIGVRSGKFYGINSANGIPVWETDLADSVTGTPVVMDDMVLVGTRNGLLFGLSPENGKVLWRYRLYTQRAVNVRDDRNDDRGRVSQTGFGGARESTSRDTTRMQTYGVSSMPAVVDGAVYVLGDNAALYAFSTQPFDADPPRVVNPTLSVPNSAGKPALMRLDTDKPLLVAGRAPIQMVLELSDVGSGVNPDTIQVWLNKTELAKTAIEPFSDTTGRLLITLAEQKGRVTLNLDDGLYAVEIKAADYRGNELTYTANFLVDNTVPPPAAPATSAPTRDRDTT